MEIETLQTAANRVIDQKFSQGLASLSEQDRVLFLVWSYLAAIGDGGFASFYYNSFADHHSETVDALRKLGLDGHAELLERSAHMLFGSDVPRTTEARNEAMDELPEEVGTDEEFDELMRSYTAQGGGDRVLEVLQDWYFS